MSFLFPLHYTVKFSYTNHSTHLIILDSSIEQLECNWVKLHELTQEIKAALKYLFGFDFWPRDVTNQVLYQNITKEWLEKQNKQTTNI